MPDTQTTPATRVEAAVQHFQSWHGVAPDANEVGALLAAIDAVDPLRVPSPHMAGKVPLVLYFATRADADDFAAIVKDAFVNPVEVVL